MVSLLRCEKYELEKLRNILLTSIDNLGGLDAFFVKGETVLLKVNLIMSKKPEEAATTHPVFVEALAEILIKFGCQVIIGDSPGGPFNLALLKNIYKNTGMEEVAKKTGATLNFDTSTTTVENPHGQLLKRLTVGTYITKPDKIVSVAKLKSHCMTKITGATKNMFGAVPGTVKAEYHFNCPDPVVFTNSLIDICLYTNPVLSFIDGIVGMEGHGPTGGTPIQTDVVICSNSPYEADLAMATIVNIKKGQAPIIDNIIERKLADYNKISYIGDNIDTFIKKDFVIPKTSSMHFLGDNPPKFLEDFVKNNLHPKPVFRKDRCIGCGICAESCPPKIIEMNDKFPVADLSKCIRCFCCQELCPKKAVDVHRPALLKLMSRF